MSTPADIYTWGLDALEAALAHRSKEEAGQAVAQAVRSLSEEDLRRVVMMLAVESVWSMRPRRSRRELQSWIDRTRFRAITHGFEVEHD